MLVQDIIAIEFNQNDAAKALTVEFDTDKGVVTLTFRPKALLSLESMLSDVRRKMALATGKQ